jgi:riboflavin kinase / FMN adenylyltransferase
VKRSVVAIGVFDGVHRGHVAILERAVRLARERQLESVVVSFDPHPDVVLAKTFRAKPPLTPLPEKRLRLQALGVDRLVVLPFTRELAALEAEEFVDRHLVAPHRPDALVVGENFALGRARAGDPARLAEIGTSRGFMVESVALEWVDGAPVSSTRIRELLGDGKVAEAANLLGRRYGLAGTVVTGDGIGRTLGVPTANLRLHEEKLVPANGIYAVWTRLPGESGLRPAAMSIGVRPTFGGQSRTLEVHVLDWEGDLRGRDVEVELVQWLRPELRFDGPTELIAAMQDDLARTRRLLASEEASAFRSTR